MFFNDESFKLFARSSNLDSIKLECRANFINLSSLIFPSTKLQSSLVKELDKIKEFVWCILVYGNKYLLTKRAIIEPTIIKVNLVVDKISRE